uniref:Uncharacterized protein n=1 Tax=Oryza sativa subsp. japonica TaxID=39947 RepID=Q7XIU6_ORYSJ|nr:hypothetical protein [Oryza sativa Japonica Group]BAD30638.1 hypothetical protein [Oryza sativa Japonica Group]
MVMQTNGRRTTEEEDQSCGSTPQKPDHPPTRCRSQAKRQAAQSTNLKPAFCRIWIGSRGRVGYEDKLQL